MATNPKRQMILKNIYVTLFLFVGLVNFNYAQLINTGQLYVAQNTQFSSVQDIDLTSSSVFINDGEVIIYNDYTNEGVVDYTTVNGSFSFTGSSQLISGNGTNYFNILILNSNTSQSDIPQFQSSTILNIDNELVFENGILATVDQDGLVVFNRGAIFSDISNDSHIDGLVRKIGEEEFDFPIGDGGFFRPVIIGEANEQQSFTATYILNDPDDMYPRENRSDVISMISDKEYWIVSKDTENSEVIITLSWDEQSTTPEEIVAEPQSAIHVVRWDADIQLWVDEGGVVDIVNKTVSTLSSLDEFGVFTLARVKEELILPAGVVIYNLVSPNGDNKNDYFIIDNISQLDNNKVEIYNRWGQLLFKTEDYDSSGNVFTGVAEGRNMTTDGLLPSGTYFYVIEYDVVIDGITEEVREVGYLFLNTDG